MLADSLISRYLAIGRYLDSTCTQSCLFVKFELKGDGTVSNISSGGEAPAVVKIFVEDFVASKSILNPKQTTLYLFLTYECARRIKARTAIKILPEQWDFNKGKYKTSLKGSLELNNELDTIVNGLLKQYAKLKDERDFLDEAEIRGLLEGQLNGNIPMKRDSLAKAKAEFETTKQEVLAAGTLKEYRTVFKSLDDLQAKRTTK